MVFRVVVIEPAEQDIDEATHCIAKDSFSAALKWNAELWNVICSLQEMSARFSVIQDAEQLGIPYRAVNHYSHRLIFRLDETTKTVFIVRVYHGARISLTSKGVSEPNCRIRKVRDIELIPALRCYSCTSQNV